MIKRITGALDLGNGYNARVSRSIKEVARRPRIGCNSKENIWETRKKCERGRFPHHKPLFCFQNRIVYLLNLSWKTLGLSVVCKRYDFSKVHTPI